MISLLKKLFKKREKPKEYYEKLFKRYEECGYFVRGYKCSCDCNPCEFAKEDGSGSMDVDAAKNGKKICKQHGGKYNKYYQCAAEMLPEDYEYFINNFTQEEKEMYEEMRLACVK